MPRAVGTACAEPGCPKITTDSRCETHRRDQRRLQERDRASAASRGYDYRWRQFRERVLEEVGWRCERCQHRPVDTSRLHAHHVLPVSDFTELRLERTNVEVLCHRCHNRHERKMERLSPPRVTVVCGPPASGKTTYALEHAAEDDLIVDADRIARAITPTEGHGASERTRDVVLDVKGFLERRLTQPMEPGRAWVVTTAPTPEEREQLARKLSADVTVLEVTAEECKRRLRGRGGAQQGEYERAVERWWREYRPRTSEQVVRG